MKTLVEELKEMVSCAKEESMYPTEFSEPIMGYSCVSSKQECELFQTIIRRIEEEYIERPRFDDGTIIKIGDLAAWGKNGKRLIRDVKVGVLIDGEGIKYEKVIKRFGDSMEKIAEDAEKNKREYWECEGRMCSSCPSLIKGVEPCSYYKTGTDCHEAQKRDLLKRTRKVLAQM